MPRSVSRSRWAATVLSVTALALAGACQGGGDQAPQSSREPGAAEAPPSRAAIVARDSTVVAVWDGEAHPLEGSFATPGQRVLWSPGGDLMTVNVGGGFWEWAGPDGPALLHECGPGCQGVYLGDRLYAYGDGEIRWLPADGAPEPVPVEAEQAGGAGVWGAVDGRLLVGDEGPESRADTEDLWLLDPDTGEAAAVGDLPAGQGLWTPRTALSAGGGALAVEYEGDGPDGCPVTEGVVVVDTASLEAGPLVPPPEANRGGVVLTWDLFFNGGRLYAVFAELYDGCLEDEPMGLWRLDGETWERVSEGAFYAVRPLEGLDGGDAALVADADFTCKVVALPGGAVRADLGPCGPEVWSTPTFGEVDLSGLSGR